MIGHDARQWIRPNRGDYERWKSEAGLNLNQTLDKRHRHSVLFNYYFNYLKRYMLVMMTASVVAYAPQLTELPTQALQAYKFYELTQKSEGMSDSLNASFLTHLAEENARERDSLVAESSPWACRATSATSMPIEKVSELSNWRSMISDSLRRAACGVRQAIFFAGGRGVKPYLVWFKWFNATRIRF